MRYKHHCLSLELLIDIANKSGAVVGEDIVDHFLNVTNRGRKLVGFATTIAPVDGKVMPHYHFVFEEIGIIQ